jgi:hypothetical protein
VRQQCLLSLSLMYKVSFLHSVEAFTSKSLALFSGYPLALYDTVECVVFGAQILDVLPGLLCTRCISESRYAQFSFSAIDGSKHDMLPCMSRTCSVLIARAMKMTIFWYTSPHPAL